MNRAVMPITDYENTCDKIREKTETTDLIKSGELPDKIDEVYEAGQKDEHDSFWDAYQQYGNRTDYRTAFAFSSWTDAIFRPKYDIVLNQKLTNWDSQQAFEGCGVQDIAACLNKNNVTIDTSQAENLDSVFRTAKTVSLPPLDLSNCLKTGMTFYYMASLKSLELRNLREDCTFDRPISFCYALENLRITGTIGNNGIDVQYSPLTKESLLNVIDCLKDFGETVVEDCGVNVLMPHILTTNTLVEGAKYYLTYEGDDFEPYTSEATAGQVTVMPSGISALGLEFEFPSQTSGDIPLIWVYQDGGNLMYDAYFVKSNAKITLSKAPTETRSITFGITNLAKLTDAEKAVATQKGWTLL